jgi:hypothetical protein
VSEASQAGASSHVSQFLSADRRSETIDTFEWTGLRGPIRLKNPEVEFVIYEDCEWLSSFLL